MKLGIVIPTKNEQDNIKALSNSIKKNLKSIKFIVCFVDKSDDDKTIKMINKHFDKKNIHIISIGGSIMHDLAINLKNNGYQITGSDDIIYDPSKSKLKKNGLLPNDLGYTKNNIHSKIEFLKEIPSNK